MGRDIPLRLAALLCDLENALEILKRLRYDNATIDRVESSLLFNRRSCFLKSGRFGGDFIAMGRKIFSMA